MADKDFRVKLGLHVGANAYIEGNITSVDLVQMNVASPGTVGGAGQLAWNTNDNTLDIGMNALTTLQVGQEEYYYVKNHTAVTIPDGTVVMANGTNGASGRIHVEPAVANGTIPSKYILGITTEDIPAGNDGFVTAFGKVRGIDTTMFSEGDILYANPSTPGGLSNTAPAAPNNIVTLAIVINKHVNNGTLFVRPTYGSNFNENEDVHLESVSDGQALVYVSANARFENKNVAAASSNSFTTISVSGQSNVVADSSSDTLTLAAGSGIQLTTDAATDTITITNTGGGGAGLIAGDYVVRATKQGGSQTVTSGADAIVTFGDDFDPQGWFASDKFQPTVAGYYSLYAQVWWDAGAVTNNQSNIQFKKNGSTQLAINQQQIVTGSGYAQTISTVVYLNGTTDYVEVTAFTGNTTSQNINSAGTGTFFTAALYAYGDAANTWVNANDYTTLLSARSNDFNTLQTAYANDYATLLSARSNDYATLLSAQANDYSTYTTLASEYKANDYATLLSAQANDYATLLSAYANDFALYSSVRSFNAFVVAGQSDLVADGFTDTITLVAGTGTTITTDPTTDSITINAVTDLSYSANATAVLIQSSSGTDAAILEANATISGVITTGTQSIAGTKTFLNTITGSISGSAGSASVLETTRTITLTGDLSGYTLFNGSADVSINATIQSNSVQLGADTYGNYVANVTGTANEVLVSGSGEGAEIVIGLPANVTISNDLFVSHNLVVTGNLTVTGNTTTISANNLAIQDNMIYLNDGSTETNPDLGFAGNFNDGSYSHAGLFRDATDARWKFFARYDPEPGIFIDTSNSTFRYADVQANTFYGVLTGNTVTANSFAIGSSELIGINRNITNYAITKNTRGSISGSQTIDLYLGNFVSATAGGSITWTFSNASASHASGFVLELTNGGSAAQTWPATVRWPGGTAPTLTTSGVDVLVFVTDDAGTNWRGIASMLDSK